MNLLFLLLFASISLPAQLQTFQLEDTNVIGTKMCTLDWEINPWESNIRYDLDLAKNNLEFERVIRFFKNNPGLSVQVGVHTDVAGSKLWLKKYSECKARGFVREVRKQNSAVDSLSIAGYGSCYPLHTKEQINSSDEVTSNNMRRSNRRITLITNPKGMPAQMLPKECFADYSIGTRIDTFDNKQCSVPIVLKDYGVTFSNGKFSEDSLRNRMLIFSLNDCYGSGYLRVFNSDSVLVAHGDLIGFAIEYKDTLKFFGEEGPDSIALPQGYYPQKRGLWTFYDDNGRKASDVYYKIFSKEELGNHITIHNKLGVQHGVAIYYGPSGEIRKRVKWVKGFPQPVY